MRCLPLKEENHGDDKRKGKAFINANSSLLITIKNCLDVCTWVYALIRCFAPYALHGYELSCRAL